MMYREFTGIYTASTEHPAHLPLSLPSWSCSPHLSQNLSQLPPPASPVESRVSRPLGLASSSLGALVWVWVSRSWDLPRSPAPRAHSQNANQTTIPFLASPVPRAEGLSTKKGWLSEFASRVLGSFVFGGRIAKVYGRDRVRVPVRYRRDPSRT